MKKDTSEGLKQIGIEKTSDHTFNVKTEDGGHYECSSPTKLDKLKNNTSIKSDIPRMAGMGEKKSLVCDLCGKPSADLKGIFDSIVKKISYKCKEC